MSVAAFARPAELDAAEPLWRASPARIEAAHLTLFRRRLEQEWDVRLPNYAALHAFTIARPAAFWRSLCRYAGIVGSGLEDGEVLVKAQCMADDRWFPAARLNFAENMLRRRDDAEALIFRCESGARRSLTFVELAGEVARAQAALRALGVGVGDRVVGYLPNVPEAVVAMLAATSLGAIWATVSADLSVAAVLDRLGQLDPLVLVTADGAHHGGKMHELLGKAREVAAALPTVRAVWVAANVVDAWALHEGEVSWRDALAPWPTRPPEFVRLPFDAPAFVLFTSGTTGRPKCLVHCVGGPLLNYAKELLLHADMHPGDRMFRLTTTGWMMWNWSTAALMTGAAVILYDGSATHPHLGALFDLAEQERVTLFGPSAAVLDLYAKGALRPIDSHDLTSMRTMFSGGTRVPAGNYEYVYRCIKKDFFFGSPSGGTDLLGTFVNGDPTGAVFAGEAPVATLGMDIKILDDDGSALAHGPGELACASSFPSMPVAFWGEPDRRRLVETYFARFPGKWYHGDWVERTVRGGYVIHGRSDATLKARGIRIGTAEIYKPLERLAELDECAAVAQEWQGDSRIVLFVKLRDGVELTSELDRTIRTTLRQGASAHHVPAHVIAVPDLPRNSVGKVMELAIRDVIHGRTPRNLAAVANPDSLAHFEGLPALSR